MKTIFDFAQRLPVGPYKAELSALEAAAVVNSNSYGDAAVRIKLLEDRASEQYSKAFTPF
jgi:hypothetical protein